MREEGGPRRWCAGGAGAGEHEGEVAEQLCSQNQNKESVLKTERKRGGEVLRRVTNAAAVTFLFPVCAAGERRSGLCQTKHP